MPKVLALVAVFAATSVFADSWSPRATAFQEKNAAERKRLGLDDEKAKKAYPTPEVRFGGGSGWACPGETTTVLLEGKLATGTLVGTASDSVEVVKEALTPKGWQATLKVKPGTQDGVMFQVIAPVSGITSFIELPVGCPREWAIDLKSGERLVVKVIDSDSRAPAEWFCGQSSLETRTFSISTDGKSTFLLARQETTEDRERIKKAEAGAKGRVSAERQAELSAKMQACTTMPAAQMGPCIQKYSGELQEMMSQQQSAIQTAQAEAAPKVGCTQLQGSIEGKKLKGNATGCAARQQFEQVPFTGVIR